MSALLVHLKTILHEVIYFVTREIIHKELIV